MVSSYRILYPLCSWHVSMFRQNREKQRENRRKKYREEAIERHNKCGVKDLTAFNAVNRIIEGDKAPIILR